MDKLLVLHDLQKRARHMQTLSDFEFFAANDSFQLIPYDQGLFWVCEGEHVALKTVSGGGVLDPKGPYGVFLSGLIKTQIKNQNIARENENYAVIVNLDESHADDAAEWKKYFHDHAALMVFFNRDSQIIGGLWLERKDVFNEAEQQILRELGDQYALTLAAFLKTKKKISPFALFHTIKGFQRYVYIGLIVLALLPVRLSITAPAEVVADNPFVIAAPFDGVLDHITVAPGEKVTAGDILAVMDQSRLESQADIARQALNVSQASLSRAQREAIAAPERMAELRLLKEDIKSKKLEHDFATTLLQRSEIKAAQDGIAIFSDKSSLEGAPFATGQKIMMLADPEQIELLIRIPIDAMIPFNQEMPVKFFLNASPLSSLPAQIHTSGYQASPDPDGLLTYKLRADIQAGDDPIRVGWKGTAKIYGDWTIFSYAALRRSLVSIRRFIGV